MGSEAEGETAGRSRLVTPRRVLLILDDCGAGDALRLSGQVRAIRRSFPDARVRMVASAGASAVYRSSRDVDEVIESRLYQRRQAGWRGRVRKLLELLRIAAAAGFDNDLVVTFWWGSRTLALLARLTGRGTRVGYGQAGRGPYDFSGDEMVQNTQLLEAAGVELPAGDPLPTLAVNAETEREAVRLLRGSGWDGSAPVVVVHTGSDWACQQWSPSGWAEVGDALVSGYGAQVVFTGTRSEKDYVRRIRGAMHERSASLAGETPLPLLAAVLRLARLVVTVDSAAYVVARSQRTPVVVLAGPSHPERLARGGGEVRIVKRMSDATAQVIDACKQPRFPDGGCLDYSCPLAGLKELRTDDVLAAVRATRALEPERAAV